MRDCDEKRIQVSNMIFLRLISGVRLLQKQRNKHRREIL